MADINTLLGLGVQPEDNLQALADQLRGQQRAGQFLGLSQIEPIKNLGNSMATGASDSAQRGGVLNQAMAKQAQAQENTKAQALAKTMEAETLNRNKIDAAKLAHERRLEHAEAQKKTPALEYEDFEDYVDTEGKRHQIAKKGGEVFTHDEEGNITLTTLSDKTPFVDPNKSTGRGGSGGIYTKFGSPKQQKDFEDLANKSQNQMTVFEQFQPEFGNESGLPIGELQSSWTGSGLPATEGMEKTQEWWKNYNDQYANIKRHDLFGSALTPGEQAAWKRANVHENSTPDQVAESMATLKYLTKKLAHKTRENAITKNRDPDYIATNYNWLDKYGEFVDLSDVPEGMNPSEWEALTYSERQEVLDLGIE